MISSQRGRRIHVEGCESTILHLNFNLCCTPHLIETSLAGSTIALHNQGRDSIHSGAGDLNWIVIYALNMDSFFPDEYEAYCTELETTPAWGGQIEVEYLNLVLNTHITIAPSVDNG